MSESPPLEFTASSRVVCISAYGYARADNVSQVDHQHLLRALLERPGKGVQAVLTGSGTTADRVRETVRARPEHEPQTSTSSMDEIIAWSRQEAESFGDTAVDDHHLLLGLLRSSGPVRSALETAGLSTSLARAEIWQLQTRVLDTTVPAMSPRPRSLDKLRESRATLGLTPSGAMTVQGPRLGWERRAHLPTRQISSLKSATNVSSIFLGLLAIFFGGSWFLAFGDPAPALARFLIISVIVSGWIVSVCVHEYGHAAAAFLGGDHTVVRRGGLTFDPRRYVDPLFSIVMPLIALLIGSIPLPGGSVGVRCDLLRSRRWELAVSCGGPLGTLICLILFSSPFWTGLYDRWPEQQSIWMALGGLSLVQATALILNLLPIPPLDGFNIVSYWLPDGFTIAARQLGWMPVFALYVILRQPTGFTDAFWNAGYRLLDVFGVDLWAAWWGLAQLRLS